MSRNVKELEEKIGYNFKDSHLLRHAVTHSSYVNEKHMKKADCMNVWNSLEMLFWN